MSAYSALIQRFVSGYKQEERDRIKANIQERVNDLRACHKQDNCKEFAALIESYIPEWIEEEQK